jgi:hypothetical protein
MKKFFVISLATALCLALALPAMAKVTAGGRACLDWGYLSQNDERAAGGVALGSSTTSNGIQRMTFDTPITLNRLNLKYTSDDGALSSFVEVRGGGAAEATTTIFVYAWIQWQITPTARITFGKQTQAFARFIPNQWVGTQQTTILGIGFGNVNHTTQRTGIKGYHRFSDMFGLVWMILDPGVAGGQPGLVVSTTGVGALASTGRENKLPRIDLALPIRFSWGRIEPSVTWTQAEYDQIPAGEDKFDMYGLSLGGTGSWGMFSATAEITYGQNLGGGSYRGAEGDVPVAYLASGTTNQAAIADGESLAWFIEVGFKFGPSKVDVMYGQISYENDEGPTTGPVVLPTLYDYTQKFYGISWAIGVAKGFTIRPELMFYDFDKDAQKFGSIINEGKEWYLGLQFMLVF